MLELAYINNDLLVCVVSVGVKWASPDEEV